MTDIILRGTLGHDQIRFFIASTTHTVERARQIHQTSPVVSAALGRLLTAAAIMGSMLKNPSDIVTLSIKGDGPAGGLLATSDSLSRVKGYPFQSLVDLPLKPNRKLDVSGALGQGTLTVIKDIGLKEPYVGQVPLVSGEIGEDLTHYFAVSEQTPSAVALGVLVDRDYTIRQAGGFLLQTLPGADEEEVTRLEQVLAGLPSVTVLMDQGNSPEEIAALLAGGSDYEISDSVPVEYHCNCDRERVEKALISLGRQELKTILAEDGRAVLHCHFCNSDYAFERPDLERVLAEAKA